MTLLANTIVVNVFIPSEEIIVLKSARLMLPAAMLIALAVAAPASALNAAHSVVVSPTPAKGTPNVLDGVVRAVVPVGNEIVVGGAFTQVRTPGGAVVNRSNIFAFNPATGAIDPTFAPALAGGEVSTLAASPDGRSVYAGGQFSTVNGVTMKRLVKLTLATGNADPAFHAVISGTWVESMVVHAGDLYIGGAFSKVNGTTRGRFAGVDLSTGAVDPNVAVNFAVKRQGTLRVAHMAINPAGTRIVATGTFTQANGLDRAQIAMLDLTTTPVSVANWETDRFKPVCAHKFDTYVRGVDFSPDGSYFVVADTGAYYGGPNAGVVCDSASRWETNATGSGVQPTWVDYTGGDSLTSVAVTGTAVYVGGHQRWQNNPFAGDAAGPGAVGRMGIAALDPVNGMPFSWNPGRHPRGSGVWALTATPTGLWVGSDTTYIDGIYHARLAFMPVAGGETVPAAQTGTLPGELVTLGGGDPSGRSFDGSTLGAPSAITGSGVDWTHVRGAFMVGNRLYTGWDNGQLLVRSFDGSSFGAPTALNLNGLTGSQFAVSALTGMFYDAGTGRLYFTVSGSPNLYYRYFEPESDIVGAQTFVASSGGIDWSGVSGMTMASGRIYYRSTDVAHGSSAYSLYSIAFTNGAPVAGTRTTIAPADTWNTRGMFVLPH
jgi:Domain of unknown function (DUF5122) beta-propeller